MRPTPALLTADARAQQAAMDRGEATSLGLVEATSIGSRASTATARGSTP